MEWTYSPDEPALTRRFIETECKLGTAPFYGETIKLLPWQLQIIDGYGWTDAKGRPKFSTYSVWIPKKNGKSSFAASLALQQLIRRKANTVAIVSATTKQAGTVFDEAAAMVAQNPKLRKRLWCRKNLKVIEDRLSPGKIEVLACRPQISGFNVGLLILDEVAEWPKCHAQTVLNKIDGAGAAKPWSHKIILSTAQFDKTHPGYDIYRLAKDVQTWNENIEVDGKRQGANRPDVMPIVFEVGEHDDWRNIDLVAKANPAVAAGVLDLDFLKGKFNALATEPKMEASFRVLHCNQWGVGSGDAWLEGLKVAASQAEFNEDDLIGCECYIGVDYARSGDLCAYAIVFKKDESIYVLPRFFIPRDCAQQKEKRDAVPYSWWSTIEACGLKMTEGDTVDPGKLRDCLTKDFEKFKPREIAFDPWGLEETRQILVDQGLPMTPVPPLPKYITGGMVRLERSIKDGRFKFQKNNLIYEWNLNNARCKPIGGSDYLRLSKALSAGRIDGVFATVLGLSRLVDHEQALSFGVF